MIPDARVLPAALIEHVPNAVLVPMGPGTGHACGALDASATPLPGARTLLSSSRFSPDPTRPEGPVARLGGRWLFAGIGRHHFGHFLLEAMPRLWALDHLSGQLDGIALIPMHGRDIAAVLRRRLGPLIEMLAGNLPVQLIDTPAQVDELILPSQGYGHLHWTAGTPEARAFMRRSLCIGPRPSGPDRIYISRSRLKKPGQSVPFEAEIERWMSRAGYEIFHPERHPVTEQIARYRAAGCIVGADGSAFHLAAFVMEPGTRVCLIQRRTRQPVFDAMTRQIKGFAGLDTITSAALATLSNETDSAGHMTGARPVELNNLRNDLLKGGFL